MSEKTLMTLSITFLGMVVSSRIFENFLRFCSLIKPWQSFPSSFQDSTRKTKSDNSYKSLRRYRIDSSPDVAVFWILQDVMLHIIWYVVTIVIIDIIIVRLFVLDIIGRDINLIYIAAISELPGEASGRLS